MRCNSCRTRLHDWFDSKGAAALPPEVSEHVRDCSDCRAFIKQWNSIELGLQSVRDQAAAPSPDFALALRSRLAREEARRAFRLPFPALPNIHGGRLAMAAVAAVLILVAMRFSGSVRALFVAHGPVIASNSAPTRTDDVKPAIPPDLPIANTNNH